MNNKPKVVVFYIATGRYLVLWKEFYATFKKYFLPNCDRHVILFTDAPKVENIDDDVTLVSIPSYSWPYITLLRFHIFMDSYNLWKDADYVFFMNANYSFKRKISKNILPKEGLVAGHHSSFWNHHPDKLPYERNSKSTAYVPYGQGKYYYQGALIGGTTSAFATMSRELSRRIDEDLKNEIIAVWHDESHLNCYLSEVGAKKLHRYYLWPEERYKWFRKPFVYAILRDKGKLGGHAFMRNLE